MQGGIVFRLSFYFKKCHHFHHHYHHHYHHHHYHHHHIIIIIKYHHPTFIKTRKLHLKTHTPHSQTVSKKKKKMGKGNQIGEVDTNDVLNASVMKIIKASAKNCSEVDIMAVKERLKADPNYKLYKRRFRFIPKLMTFLSVSSVCA